MIKIKTPGDKILRDILSRIKESGVEIVDDSLSKSVSQGLMSSVYFVDSSDGELVIHIINPLSTWVEKEIWKKIKGVSSFLMNYPKLPTSCVLISDRIDNFYFIVQSKLNGKTAGKREVIDLDIVDTWFVDKEKYVPQIQNIIASSHNIKCKDFGWPIFREGDLVGSHATWKDFFKTEAFLWLKKIKEADINHFDFGDTSLIDEYVGSFLNKISSNIDSVLIHGDAINPSNILIDKDNISGIIDWEWSLFGDPAWEFCDPGWWEYLDIKLLEPYFSSLNKNMTIEDKVDFIKRVELYKPIWFMWACSVHSDNAQGDLYMILRSILKRLLTSV